jgi:hypothetical protein
VQLRIVGVELLDALEQLAGAYERTSAGPRNASGTVAAIATASPL